VKIGELTQRLGVSYRHARYVLERGFLPPGLDDHPGSGEHRQLDARQQFWFALVLVLKSNGLRLPLAAKIAEDIQITMRSITASLNWEGDFNPFLGRFKTRYDWFADIADLRFTRIATNANPSQHKKLLELPWTEIGTLKPVHPNPFMFLRVDIGKLAETLNT
jgi:hypothetical protein